MLSATPGDLPNKQASDCGSSTGTVKNSSALRFRGLLLWVSSAGVVLLAVVVFLFVFRHRIAAAQDVGFEVPPTEKAASDSPGRPRSTVSADRQFMTLDPTGQFLINSITKKPVFITGDAAWSLITQLGNSDVDLYLSDRASHGFNYIWCGAADNNYQSTPPKNYYGFSPFDGPDFTNENAHYWEHVDYVIRRAVEYGITVGLTPAFVGLTSSGGYLPSYQKNSESVFAAYGEFLGNRYKTFPNIIWVIGGDVDPKTGVLPKLTALANGIRSKDTVHLMVAEGEPQHSALDTFGTAIPMDLNWLYFHTTNIPGGVSSSYTRSPWLPSFLGEEWYENEHTPPLTDLEYREQGYWAVLSGAYLGNGGFGNAPLWYFRSGPSVRATDPSWQSQLNSPGSIAQMYLGRLFRSREHWKLVPDLNHTVMVAGYDSRSFFSSTWEHIRYFANKTPYRLGSASSVAARTSDGQTIMAYIPNGNATTLTISMTAIVDAGSQAKCWWFNPRDGSSSLIGVVATRGTRKFTPPDSNDWVLVIDSLSANLSAPAGISSSRRTAHQPSYDKPVSLSSLASIGER